MAGNRNVMRIYTHAQRHHLTTVPAAMQEHLSLQINLCNTPKESRKHSNKLIAQKHLQFPFPYTYMHPQLQKGMIQIQAQGTNMNKCCMQLFSLSDFALERIEKEELMFEAKIYVEANRSHCSLISFK